MKYLIIVLILLLLSTPVKAAETLEAITNSHSSEGFLYRDRFGRLKQQYIQVYEYVTVSGNKVEYPYKLQHMHDLRPWRLKHKIIYYIVTHIGWMIKI